MWVVTLSIWREVHQPDSTSFDPNPITPRTFLMQLSYTAMQDLHQKRGIQAGRSMAR